VAITRSLLIKTGLATTILLATALSVATALSIQPFSNELADAMSSTGKNSYLDRMGKAINITYHNEWNIHDQLSLHQIPEFLQHSLILSEDKRFFSHAGVDWWARLSAAAQNIRAGKVVRGASTITEQVVRMLHPRPRTLWSRWLEGFEAALLEQRYSKLEILEFYLNQVPFKAQRRGVKQAASYYFDRDIQTLNEKEMLALCVLVRSPRWLDPQQHPGSLEQKIMALSIRLGLSPDRLSNLSKQQLQLQSPSINYDLSHFIAYAEANRQTEFNNSGLIHTTVDLELQRKAQQLLNSSLTRLQPSRVLNGAVLIIDHQSNEIRSWVVGYAGLKDHPFNKIDAVITPRQPGSALKPLLYARALIKGWTAATLLDDSPLDEGIGLGMHSYQNYSHDYYGLISLREALGNSLNIPALKAMQYVGTETFLSFLYELGIQSLSAHPNVYGDGLALGNGELTLYELVQAYSVLARMGDFKPLSHLQGQSKSSHSYRVMSEDIASLIADILSDPTAREKEFGWDSILNFPHQTAVKTGTSSDYRDAWALGFNDQYTVGVWMGNQDYTPMDEVTGSSGPAWVLRSLFNELNKNRQVRPLYLSENLIKYRVCIETGLLQDNDCQARDEWFIAGTSPQGRAELNQPVRLRKPSKGLLLAMDPRIPDDAEYFEFALNKVPGIKQVKWFINNQQVAVTQKPEYQWKLSRGSFTTYAEVTLEHVTQPVITEAISYRVN
jgi:penicillin-binding protein 1C